MRKQKKSVDYPIVAMPSRDGKLWIVAHRHRVFTMPIDKAKTKEAAARIAFQRKNLPLWTGGSKR